MPILIDIVGAKPIPRHENAALPASTRAPSKREAIEALGHAQAMVRHHRARSLLIDGEVVTPAQCFDILRRFILTR